jgi:hypothetical protein
VLPACLRSPRPLLLMAAFVAPFGLGACTAQSTDTGSFKGAKKEVQDVVIKLSDLAEDRKSADICEDLFSEQLTSDFAKVGGGDCAKAVDRAVRNADYTKLTIDKIDLNGNNAGAVQAFARIKVQKDGPTRTVRLVRSKTKAPWLIDGFDDAASAQTPAGTTPTPTTTAKP